MNGRLIIILLVFLLSSGVRAQSDLSKKVPSAKNDSIFPGLTNKNGYYEPTLITTTSKRVEIRLYRYSTSRSTITIIQYDNGKFDGYYFSRRNPGSIKIDRSLPNAKIQYDIRKLKSNNLDSLFFELVNVNIFSLPNQSEVTKEPAPALNRIESKINGEVRSFTFDMPIAFPLAKSKQPEFTSYLKILSIFNQIAGRGK